MKAATQATAIVIVSYSDIEDDDATLGPLFTNLTSRTKTWIVSAAGFYRLMKQNRAFLDGMAGLRYWSVDSSLKFGAGILPARESSNREEWVDPIIGLKGLLPLGRVHVFRQLDANTSTVNDVVPLIFYENGRLFIDGLEFGYRLFKNEKWQFSPLARYRFFDIPEEYQNEIRESELDLGGQLTYHMSDWFHTDLEVLSDQDGRWTANLTPVLIFERGPGISKRMRDFAGKALISTTAITAWSKKNQYR